mgnify:CR=1 FL=1
MKNEKSQQKVIAKDYVIFAISQRISENFNI